MLYTEETTRANIRTREGKRVFFLSPEDTLTPGARDYLNRERIEIRPAHEAKIEEYVLLGGGILREKPEHMTHLQGNILVRKDHPRMEFRGCMDTLEAEILLCQMAVGRFRKELGEVLALARRIVGCEVLDKPLEETCLCGMTPAQLRERSHFPQKYEDQPHFMPDVTDGEAILRLNLLRCRVRQAERAAVRAFCDAEGTVMRRDLLLALNRMSSLIYLLMIRLKREK